MAACTLPPKVKIIADGFDQFVFLTITKRVSHRRFVVIAFLMNCAKHGIYSFIYELPSIGEIEMYIVEPEQFCIKPFMRA